MQHWFHPTSDAVLQTLYNHTFGALGAYKTWYVLAQIWCPAILILEPHVDFTPIGYLECHSHVLWCDFTFLVKQWRLVRAHIGIYVWSIIRGIRIRYWERTWSTYIAIWPKCCLQVMCPISITFNDKKKQKKKKKNESNVFGLTKIFPRVVFIIPLGQLDEWLVSDLS